MELSRCEWAIQLTSNQASSRNTTSKGTSCLAISMIKWPEIERLRHVSLSTVLRVSRTYRLNLMSSVLATGRNAQRIGEEKGEDFDWSLPIYLTAFKCIFESIRMDLDESGSSWNGDRSATAEQLWDAAHHQPPLLSWCRRLRDRVVLKAMKSTTFRDRDMILSYANPVRRNIKQI